MLKNLIFALFLIAGPALFADDASPIKAHLSTDHTTIVSGQEFRLLLEVELAEGWHAYWKNPGDSGMAPSINWQLPEGWTVTHTEWPTPERFESEDTVTYGYSHKVPFLITVNAAAALPENPVEIHANIQWIVCSSETCLPAKTPVKIQIQVGNKKEPRLELKQRFDEVKDAMPKVLPNHLVEHRVGAIVVSFPDEIALNDSTHFFPETKGYKKLPKVLKNNKSVEIPRTDEGSLKGVLVMGNKAYTMDFPPYEAETESLGLFWALLFALIGGLILNLMPCVLPVVSLKVMSFVKMAGDSRKEMIKQGLAFTFGVLASFWFLAALLIGLQATGQSVGWGFQLQDPLFIAALALLFTFLALNLFGVFEFGTTIAGIAGNAPVEKQSKGARGSFWSGVFATAVATPCTGPFMGSALGYALTQPAYISFAVFTALGLGMSLPYLLIGFFPSCIRWLPKPGAWMESFKQFLGFVMLATVIWLLWVFNGQTSELGLFLLLFALLVAAMGSWIYGRFGALHRKKAARKISYWLTAIFLVGSLGLVKVASNQVEAPGSQTHAHAGWEPFSAEKVAELRKTKRPVLIDFTAKWCLICQANHLVMTNREVSKKFEEHRVVLMKADWTRYDPVITQALKKFGRSGVPLYVLYGASEEPIILPQVLTPDAIISAVEKVQNTHVR
jgi:thiol:disulfide interchange protein